MTSGVFRASCHATHASQFNCSVVTQAGLAGRRFVSHMFRLGFEHAQVVGIIVPSVAVNVMHDLVAGQWAAHFRGGDESMNAGGSELDITGRSLRLIDATASDRTEQAPAALDFNGSGFEDAETMFARAQDIPPSRCGIAPL